MNDLVRVRIETPDGDIVEQNEGRAYADKNGLEVLDEPTTNRDGSRRGPTRKGGRPIKPKVELTRASAAQRPAGDPPPPPPENDPGRTEGA